MHRHAGEVNTPMPPGRKDFMQAVQFSPQESFLERIAAQRVDIPVPQVMAEIGEVVHEPPITEEKVHERLYRS